MSEPLVIKGIWPNQRKLLRMAGSMPEVAQTGALSAVWFLVGRMQHTKLRGQNINVKTGKLLGNWNVRPAATSGSIGAVGFTNTMYAAAQEFGIDQIQNVKAHLRRELNPDKLKRAQERRGERGEPSTPKQGSRRKMGLLPMSPRQTMTMNKGARKLTRLSGIRHFVVRAHQRHMILKGRRFLRETITENSKAARLVAKDTIMRELFKRSGGD